MSTPHEATVKATPSEPSGAAGSMIGRYKLLEKVGEGGFGVVYVAEQKEPVKRRVALKIIKLGMDTREVVARFEAERQALALMDHPHIAKVFDAGATENGRPYFVMELVRGIRITDYCDQASLSAKERIGLFIQVCQAIQHAHQKGIIHRDIKPSNILVTLHDGVAIPKVIDFGIAKATQQDLTEKTVYTQLQQFVGTPAYMSPEQAEMSGLDIDTRSDIYSLGVLLYELLTGRTPFDQKQLLAAGLDGMRRIIREQEPVRPSTRINTLQAEERTTTAKRRSAEAPKLISQLRGDLDWVVMKCLEKERSRRYDTANALTADLNRFLRNEPVTARPPSAAYHLQKLLRRHRAAALSVAAVFLSLLAGTVISTYAFVRERDSNRRLIEAERERELARKKAEVETVRGDAVSKFVNDLITITVPEMARQGNRNAARGILTAIQELAPAAFSNAPVSEILVRRNVGRVYGVTLNDFTSMAEEWRRIDDLAINLPDGKPPMDFDQYRLSRAQALLWGGEEAEGQRALEALNREFLSRSPPAKDLAVQCLSWHTTWLYHKAEFAMAEAKAAEAYRYVQEMGGPSGDCEAFLRYAKVLFHRKAWKEAEQVALLGLNATKPQTASHWRKYAELISELSSVYCRQVRFADAAEMVEKKIDQLQKAACPVEVLNKVRRTRGGVYARSARPREALPLLLHAATNSNATVGELYNAATVALSCGETGIYTRLCGDALFRFAAGAENLDAVWLATILLAMPQAEPVLVVVDRLISRLEENKDWTEIYAAGLRGWHFYRLKQYPEAVACFAKVPNTTSTNLPPVAARIVANDWGQQKIWTLFRRSMARAQVGDTTGAIEDFTMAVEFLGGPENAVESYPEWYLADATRREAEELFKARGIKLPNK